MLSTLKKIINSTVYKLKKKVPVYVPVLQSNLLQDRVALITGGTSGIGFSIAKAFLEAGAYVVITGRNSDRVQKSCSILIGGNTEYHTRVYGIEMNSSDTKSMKTKFESILSMLQGRRIDILVNNAGVIKGGRFGEVSDEDYCQTMDTNLKGAYFLSQIIAKYMKGHNIKGNILNIASSSSLRPAVSPYTLSKWGLRGLTAGLGKMLIPYNIVVNGLAPGPTATPMLVKNGYDGIELLSNPSGRYATAEEIANMAVILVSSLGRLVVGDIVYMTGGAGVVTVDDMNYSF